MSTPNPEKPDSAQEETAGSQNRRNLSEISHLFLSDLRSGPDRTPPRRTPPGAEPADPPQAAPQAAPRAEPPAPVPHAFADESVTGSDEEDDYHGDESIDLTPDEFADLVAQQFGGSASGAELGDEADREGQPHARGTRHPRVCAVIGARLNGTFVRRSCQYAASLCETKEETVGVVVVEPDRLRVLGVSSTGNTDAEKPEEISDVEGLRAAFNELQCDIRQWLVVLPDPHLPAARRLLGRLEQWVLLATADHDGVVSSYRTLKGLCELPVGDDECPEGRSHHEGPRIMLALLDAPNATEAHRHARKLVGVCKQFLDLELAAGQSGPPAGAVSHSAGHATQEILVSRLESAEMARAIWAVVENALCDSSVVSRVDHQHASIGQAQSSSTPPTPPAAMFDSRQTSSSQQSAPVVDSRFIPPIAHPVDRPQANRHESAPQRTHQSRAAAAAQGNPKPQSVRRQLIDEIRIPDIARPVGSTRQQADAPTPPTDETSRPAATPAQRVTTSDEVIDLPAGSGVADVVLDRLEVVTTPIVPPMLPGGKLCVDREGGLMLIAAASPGLNDLGVIGRAMTWVAESRQLLTMALAQYRLSSADVRLHLLVSHADADADALRPLLGTGRVSVQRYRRLTWGGRCGVLLEAA